jgi:biotin transport system substrate-specific component
MTTVAIDSRGTLLEKVIRPSLITNVLLVVVGAAFVGLLAQISWTVHPFVVPFTGQTLGVLVVGSTLGLRRAVSSMALYIVAGLAGVPWFAAHTHGYPSVLFGYLLGFVVAAALMSYLAEKGRDRTTSGAIGLFVLGELAIYAVGVPWLAVAAHQSLGWALTNGLVPFLVWDIAKAVVAGVLLPASWRLVGPRS